MGERLPAQRRRLLLQTVPDLRDRQGSDANDAGGRNGQKGAPSYCWGFRCVAGCGLGGLIAVGAALFVAGCTMVMVLSSPW